MQNLNVTVTLRRNSLPVAERLRKRAENLGNGARSLLSMLQPGQVIHRRERGPAGPYSGRTLSNGHWALTDSLTASKAFQRLWDKASKLAETGLSDCRDGADFERVTPPDRYQPCPIRPDVTVELAKPYKASASEGVVLTTTEKGTRVAFDLKYVAPLLACGLEIRPCGEYEPALLFDDGEMVGLLMPRRL